MFTTERMRGSGYTHYNHAWSGNAMIQLMHWGVTLTAQYQHSQRDLWGETISWGEDATVIDISYNRKGWQFGAGILMPFGRYDQGSKSLNKWNRNEQHMRLNMRMPYVTIAYLQLPVGTPETRSAEDCRHRRECRPFESRRPIIYFLPLREYFALTIS